MRASPILLAVAFVAALAGCETLLGPSDDAASTPLTELPRALSADEVEVIGASNRFAFDLLREASVRDSTPNVFLSPLSASMALGMTMNGAAGETFTGMRAALGFGTMAPAEINAAYRNLIDLLLELDGSVDMRLANSIWVDQPFPLHETFVQSSAENFDARVASLDFRDPGSVKTINAWVHQSTNGKIDTILEEIDSTIVMYLMNAVYFKGIWTQQFDPKATHEAPFHREDGTQSPVDMMHIERASVRSFQSSEVEIVDLPYGREAFSMTLVLPKQGVKLEEWAGTLTAETWHSWMGQLRDSELDIYLPRFSLEYEQVLNETLLALGMERAFDKMAADFSGMSPLGADLYIDAVKQKTFLEVNEKGTEAAAVTSVGMGLISLPPSFRADRPFLLAIRERLSGTILFLGTIGDPAVD